MLTLALYASCFGFGLAAIIVAIFTMIASWDGQHLTWDRSYRPHRHLVFGSVLLVLSLLAAYTFRWTAPYDRLNGDLPAKCADR